MNRQIPMVASAFTAALILGGTFAPPAWSVPTSALARLDPDKDGTVDLADASAVGSAAFGRLETDDNATLDHRELHGRLNAKHMAAADPDKDGTLDKTEYLTLVEQRFKASDPDNDGMVDANELTSPAGHCVDCGNRSYGATLLSIVLRSPAGSRAEQYWLRARHLTRKSEAHGLSYQ